VPSEWPVGQTPALSHLLALKRDLNPEQAVELHKYAEKHFAALGGAVPEGLLAVLDGQPTIPAMPRVAVARGPAERFFVWGTGVE
jgi:hypothetical protein